MPVAERSPALKVGSPPRPQRQCSLPGLGVRRHRAWQREPLLGAARLSSEGQRHPRLVDRGRVPEPGVPGTCRSWDLPACGRERENVALVLARSLHERRGIRLLQGLSQLGIWRREAIDLVFNDISAFVVSAANSHSPLTSSSEIHLCVQPVLAPSEALFCPELLI